MECGNGIHGRGAAAARRTWKGDEKARPRSMPTPEAVPRARLNRMARTRPGARSAWIQTRPRSLARSYDVGKCGTFSGVASFSSSLTRCYVVKTVFLVFAPQVKEGSFLPQPATNLLEGVPPWKEKLLCPMPAPERFKKKCSRSSGGPGFVRAGFFHPCTRPRQSAALPKRPQDFLNRSRANWKKVQPQFGDPAPSGPIFAVPAHDRDGARPSRNGCSFP